MDVRVFVALFVGLFGCEQVSGLSDFDIAGGGAGGNSTGGGSAGGGAAGGMRAAGGAGGSTGTCPNHVIELKEANTDFVEVVDADDLDGLVAFTIEAWVRLDNAVGTNEVHIVSHHNHDANQGWVVMVSNGNAEFRVYDGAWQGVTGAAVPQGKWTHVAGVYDGTQVHVLVNGSRDTGAMSGPPALYNGPLRIGRAAYVEGFPFLGHIDDVRLSSAAIYDAASSAPTAELERDANTIALWRFEGTGPTAVDDTGAHDGTLMGGTVRVEDACPITPEL